MSKSHYTYQSVIYKKEYAPCFKYGIDITFLKPIKKFDDKKLDNKSKKVSVIFLSNTNIPFYPSNEIDIIGQADVPIKTVAKICKKEIVDDNAFSKWLFDATRETIIALEPEFPEYTIRCPLYRTFHKEKKRYVCGDLQIGATESPKKDETIEETALRCLSEEFGLSPDLKDYEIIKIVPYSLDVKRLKQVGVVVLKKKNN